MNSRRNKFYFTQRGWKSMIQISKQNLPIKNVITALLWLAIFAAFSSDWTKVFDNDE